MPKHTKTERVKNSIEKRRKFLAEQARVKAALKRKKQKRSGARFI